jgi:ribosomal protein S18 acetylase RimI-like enzyme
MLEKHLTLDELERGLLEIRKAPRDAGTLQLIARRPAIGEREILERAELNTVEGLVGDTWRTRPSSRTPDGSPHPEMQLTLMNARAIEVIAQDKARWHLAGDQLFVDMDLSEENLPAGMLLAIGTARVEITAQPHTGCQKFVARFGNDALKFVMSPVGRQLRLRGANARVVQPGAICAGDRVKKILFAPIEILAARADSPAARELIAELDAHLESRYPPQSCHGYRVEKLLTENVAFYIAYAEGAPAGCGGIQFGGDEYAEVKRMFVRPQFRGKGLGKHLLDHLERLARAQGISRLRLETGIHQHAAIALYERAGFYRIPPFGGYFPDPNSRCYEKRLVE